MKILSIVMSVILFLGMNTGVRAETAAVPRRMAAPMVFYDEGGNLLPDGEYTVQIALLNRIADVLYAEEQAVEVFNGVGTISIGAGFVPDTEFTQPAGGLTPDLFLGDGEITVEIRVKGQALSQQSASLAAQPFAFVSELALSVATDAVTSLAIQDGVIVADDLDPSFLDELRTIVPVGADGEILTAEEIVMPDTAGLNNSGADDVMGALKDIDSAIESLRDIDLDQSLEHHAETVAGVHGVSGTVVGTDDPQTLSNKTVDATNSISGDAVNSGTVAESMIDPAIARDSELDFGNIAGMVEDAQIPSALARDSELEFVNISGVLDDGQIPSSVTRDAELDFGNISGAVSDAQIPSGIARDAELSFGNISGSLSDSQIPATIARDSEMSSAYLGLSGGTISGDLDLAGNDINTVGFVDGVDLAALNAMVSGLDADIAVLDSRVDTLESAVIDEDEIPSPVRPFAYGTMTKKSGGTCTGYNIDADCTFTTNAIDADYAVTFSWVQSGSSCGAWGGDGACFVAAKNSTGFSISCFCAGGSSFNPQIDFVVFKK